MEKEVVIIFNRGGWGNGGLQRAREERGVLQGISQSLSLQGWRYALQVFDRLPSPASSAYAKALFDLLGGYKQASLNLEEQIRTILAASPQKRILLVGYSLGAIVNISVMRQFLQEPRVYSIDIGVPLFARSFPGERILNLQRQEDAFSRGPLLPGLFVIIRAVVMLVLNIPTFRGRSLMEAWHIKGHEYPWDDPVVRIPIEQFLRSNFSHIVLR